MLAQVPPALGCRLDCDLGELRHTALMAVQSSPSSLCLRLTREQNPSASLMPHHSVCISCAAGLKRHISITWHAQPHTLPLSTLMQPQPEQDVGLLQQGLIGPLLMGDLARKPSLEFQELPITSPGTLKSLGTSLRYSPGPSMWGVEAAQWCQRLLLLPPETDDGA